MSYDRDHRSDGRWQDMRVMEILEAHDGPVGAANVFAVLSDEMRTSEATIGRRLRVLDRTGCTRKVGRRGRVLTDKGRQQLRLLRSTFRKSETISRLLRELETNTKDKLLEVLEARILLEGPLADLAARRGHQDQMVLAEEVLAKESEAFLNGQTGADEDAAFHNLVAEMSQNRVLEKALQLVRHESELSPHVASIRQQVGHRMIADHRRILSAIRDKDGERAQAFMVSHLESIKRDVERLSSTLHGMWAESAGE